MKREIEIFNKKSEKLVGVIELQISDEVLFNYYKDYIKDDTSLVFDYDIKECDIDFYKNYTSIKFDFSKNDYFLSCHIQFYNSI